MGTSTLLRVKKMLTIIKIFLKITSLFAPNYANKMAFKLYFMPAKRAQISDVQKELMLQAKQENTIINGKKTILYRWGESNRAVLMVHGWESRASHFTKYIQAFLDKGYSVLAFDAPAHGWSRGDNTNIFEFCKAIDAVTSKDINVDAIVSHSFGSVCAAWSIKQGLKCRKFIVINGLCRFDHLIDEFSSMLSISPKMKKAVIKLVDDMCLPLTDIWNKLSLDDSPHLLNAEMLVIHEKSDRKLSWANGKKIADAYGVELVTTEGFGHTNILNDNNIVQKVVDFVGEVSASKKAQNT